MDVADLEALNWNELGRALTVHARRRLGSRGSSQEAEDVAARAVETLCRRLSKGELANLPSTRAAVVAWLRTTIDLQLKNDARTKQRSMINAFEEGGTVELVEDDGVPDPQEHLLLKRRSAAVTDAILDRISKDQLAGDVFLLGMDGADSPAEQAEQLGQPVNEIYKARSRLDRHYRAVVEQLRAEVEHG